MEKIHFKRIREGELRGGGGGGGEEEEEGETLETHRNEAKVERLKHGPVDALRYKGRKKVL